MLRAGVIGCGGITERRHGPVLASLSDRVTIAALADLAPERTELMGDKLGVASEHLYSDWERMLAIEELDLVHICTPHHLHEPQAIAAMGAGAHVFLEKPIATRLEEVDRMIAVAEKTGRKLTVGHNQLFSAAHQAAMEQIRAGAIGSVFLVRSEGFSRSHVVGRGVDQQWRTEAEAGGGGPLIDNGYHQVYTALDYVSSPAVRVFARIGRHVQDIEVEDTALVLIEHASGATTSLQVGWSALAGAVSVNEIMGTAGQIRFGGSEAPVSVWRKETGEWTQPPVDAEGPDELGFPVVVRHFVDAVENDGAVPVSAADGRHVLAIVLAAYESGRSGESVEVDSYE
ncbi:MAG: Gfo/Idh/MocA family oxidoreductase [Candidatus Poribacteria bacterium]|nr:Gfo/Idh/MocA family oxidoreductase [Candidatus Poribacteria bacterium]